MIKVNPYRKKRFTTSNHMLKFDKTPQQYAEVDNPNIKWAGGTNGFACSAVFEMSTIPAVVTVLYTLRVDNGDFNSRGYLMLVDPVDSNFGKVYFIVLTNTGTFTSVQHTVEKGKLYRFSCFYELPGPQNAYNTALVTKLNGGDIARSLFGVADIGVIPSLGPINIGRNGSNPSTNTNLDGFLNSMVFYNDFIDEIELDYLHYNNSPSDVNLSKVSAFYPFQESDGGTIHDTGPLTHYDMTLVNYSAPDLAPGTQTVWYDLYTKTLLT